jgi:hypothetical protein
MELRQRAWNTGFELTHIALIHYRSRPARRIWTVGAIFRPVPCLGPSRPARSSEMSATTPPPEPAC